MRVETIFTTILLSLAMVFVSCTNVPKEVAEPVQAVEEPIEDPVEPIEIEEEPALVEEIETVVAFEAEIIHFEFDRSDLNIGARDSLNRLADHLKTNIKASIQIDGHADSRGTTEYNMALGQKRAESAARYLIDLGVDPSRISTVSYGEEMPIMEGHDESAWSQNRRDEFKISIIE